MSTGKGSTLAQITPNGKLAEIALRDEDSVAIVDTEKLALRSKIKSCAKPAELAIVPDSSKAFVACTASNQIGVIDLKADRLLTLLDVGKTPVHITVKPDGCEVFVCNFDDSSVSEIITGSNEVNSSFLIGNHP